MKKLFFFILIFAKFYNASTQNIIKAKEVLDKTEKLYFIENKGQWHSDVLYLCRTKGLDIWITNYGINYTFYKIEDKNETNVNFDNQLSKKYQNLTLIGHRVLFELLGHNTRIQTEGRKKQEGYYNYFIGKDESKYASNVNLYKEILIKGIYNGIDIRYYFDNGCLRFDFIVHPGANPSKIRFKFTGQEKDYSQDGKEILFYTRFGKIKITDLKVFQDEKQIESKFLKKNNEWSISVGNYNLNRPLLIDPLVFSTYIGGSNCDYGYDVDVDNQGNSYVTGITYSTNYDITTGAFQSVLLGGVDCFITKLNSNGSSLIFSTFLGGSLSEEGKAIAVDSNNNIYVTGFTQSSNFMTTPGAFQTSNDGSLDVFLTKLSSNGLPLFSTYIGGSGNDYGMGLAVDNNGNSYITGYTNSTNYDVTTGCYQSTYGGGNNDVFVTKINSAGNALVFSTYIGSNGEECGSAIDIDAFGNTYITGWTNSNNYVVTSGAYQTSNNGNIDIILTKLNPSGNLILFSTYIGGSLGDIGESINLDQNGFIYLTGYTNSTNYIVTSNAFQASYGGGLNDAFITKVNPSATSIIYSSYLGGSLNDKGKDITIDPSGNVYVFGNTNSINFSVTTGAIQTSLGGSTDCFLIKFNSNSNTLNYSTFIGGGNTEIAGGVKTKSNNYVYLTGTTQSINFPITSGAFQTNYEGSCDVFLLHLCTAQEISITPYPLTTPNNQTVCVNQPISNITYTTIGISSVNVIGLPAGVSESFNSSTLTIFGTPSVSGTFIYTITPNGTVECNTVSITGTLIVSLCTEKNENLFIENISIYPNPNNGKFTIVNKKRENVQLEIIDIYGREIQNLELKEGLNEFNLILSSGFYFVKYKSSNKNFKMIVE